VNLIISGLLWAVVAVLALMVAVRSPYLLRDSAKFGLFDFLRLIPRLGIGVIGSGFLAEILPHALIARWLGPDAGFFGIVIATIAGALTPGGPVVGFAIAAASLKSGAAAPAIIAYVTAWALFAFQRVLIWELPTIPADIVLLRVAASLPLPFMAAAMAMLLGKP
jgi:hypothetical protein